MIYKETKKTKACEDTIFEMKLSSLQLEYLKILAETYSPKTKRI